MRKLSILLVLLLLCSLIAFPMPVRAQSASSYWVKSYGGRDLDEAYGVAIAPNGDIIVTGWFFTMRLDSNGEIIWAKKVGGNAVAIADNGDIIVAGTTERFGAGWRDVWVLRLDESGNVKWQKTYGGSDNEWATAVAVAPNGDIIVAGFTFTFGAGQADVWVLRLDESGNVKWQKTYGGSDYDEAYAVAIADNGDIIVAGDYGGHDVYGALADVWVLRLDEDGNVKWQKTYGGGWNDGVNAVAIAPNGDVIVAGYTKSFGAGQADVWVLRLDEYGNVKWQKTYGGSSWDGAITVALVDNGDIIVVGWTKSFGAGEYDGWVLRLDENGNVKWQKTYGESSDDWANAVAIAPNGDVIVAGRTESFGTGGRNVWVLRLPQDGNLPGCKFCSDSNARVSYSNAKVSTSNAEVASSSATVKSSTAEVQNTNAEVKTQWPPGTLKITSNPSGAKVYINGDYKGITPLTLDLAPGTYTVKLTKDEYEDYTKTVEVNPGETTTLSATLTPKFGYLTVYSSPSDAEVYVDGDYVGKTPLEDYKLSTGDHSVVVKKNDYQDYRTTVTIEPGKTTKVEATLSEVPATLEVSSDPSGADVYVDSFYKGTTPLTIQLSPGSHTVRITKGDYEVYTTTVTLSPGETKSISATLKPAYGYLNVESDPSGAKVYVDGDYVGTTPLEDYKLSPGEHTLRITKDGYEEYTKTVTVEAGKSVSVSAGLVAVQTTHETTTTHSTPYSQTEPPSPTEAGRTSGGLNPTYLIAALIGLVLIGGIAVKAKGRKPKPSPSPGDTARPAPTPTKKPELRTPSKPVPYFPPELLDKYEPLEFLGEGGFAKVFKAKRKSDGKIIALKVSRLDEKAKKFFLKEVRAWRLLDHPNIVKLYNAFDEPLPHLEIEFVDGIKLDGEFIRDLGKYPKPVDEKKALHFIRGIAEGLKHAHSRQVFHRDLKPQNVLITSDLTPKITDWGLAKVGAVSTTATTTKGLTLLYAAPEQLDDETYGHTDNRTDIYQLGLIFYELLTGKLPYQGTSPAVVMAKVINPDIKPKPPSHFDKALAKYDGIFEKLLAKRKEERYQSVEEFLRDLELMEKLDEERTKLAEEIEKTKTIMSMTTDSKDLKKLMRQLVEQLSRNALLHAQLNDKAELINTLEDLKAFSKAHRNELENAISQFEVMMRESVPISRSTLDELRVLLHKVQREVEG